MILLVQIVTVGKENIGKHESQIRYYYIIINLHISRAVRAHANIPCFAAPWPLWKFSFLTIFCVSPHCEFPYVRWLWHVWTNE